MWCVYACECVCVCVGGYLGSSFLLWSLSLDDDYDGVERLGLWVCVPHANAIHPLPDHYNQDAIPLWKETTVRVHTIFFYLPNFPSSRKGEEKRKIIPTVHFKIAKSKMRPRKKWLCYVRYVLRRGKPKPAGKVHYTYSHHVFLFLSLPFQPTACAHGWNSTTVIFQVMRRRRGGGEKL